MLARLAIALVGGFAVLAAVLGGLSLLVSSGDPSPSNGGISSVFESWFARRTGSRADFESTDRGAIVPASEAPNLLRQCSRGNVGGVDSYWRPTRELVSELEERLPSFVAGRPEFAQLDAYTRQYGGLVISGRGLIYVSFVSGATPDRVRREVVARCGEAATAPGLVFDVDRKTFGELQLTVPGRSPEPRR